MQRKLARRLKGSLEKISLGVFLGAALSQNGAWACAIELLPDHVRLYELQISRAADLHSYQFVDSMSLETPDSEIFDYVESAILAKDLQNQSPSLQLIERNFSGKTVAVLRDSSGGRERRALALMEAIQKKNQAALNQLKTRYLTDLKTKVILWDDAIELQKRILEQKCEGRLPAELLSKTPETSSSDCSPYDTPEFKRLFESFDGFLSPDLLKEGKKDKKFEFVSDKKVAAQLLKDADPIDLARICRGGIGLSYLVSEFKHWMISSAFHGQLAFKDGGPKTIENLVGFSILEKRGDKNHVHLICTSEEAKGLGSQLMDKASKGVKSVTLEAVPKALGFYKKYGFFVNSKKTPSQANLLPMELHNEVRKKAVAEFYASQAKRGFYGKNPPSFEELSLESRLEVAEDLDTTKMGYALLDQLKDPTSVEADQLLNWAVFTGRVDAVDKLKRAGLDISKVKEQDGRVLDSILAAALEGKTQLVKKLINERTPPPTVAFKRAIITAALRSGNEETLALVLDSKNVNDPIYGGLGWNTPLAAAIRMKKYSLIDPMMKLGADPFKKNGKGQDAVDAVLNAVGPVKEWEQVEVLQKLTREVSDWYSPVAQKFIKSTELGNAFLAFKRHEHPEKILKVSLNLKPAATSKELVQSFKDAPLYAFATSKAGDGTYTVVYRQEKDGNILTKTAKLGQDIEKDLMTLIYEEGLGIPCTVIDQKLECH